MKREARGPGATRAVGDGRAYYEGLGDVSDEEGVIVGSPVSPGTVEGTVRVVLDPRTRDCGTARSSSARGPTRRGRRCSSAPAGLVTEVGGMMTHGSVVAREYGIPAVVGVHEATTRLDTGQRVRVDGTAGTIVVLDEAGPEPRPSRWPPERRLLASEA